MLDDEPGQEENSAEPSPRSRWIMHVLWPAFVMAGVLDALVFAVVDPGDLTWFGGQPMGLPRQAVYTLSFFIMWLVIAVACGLTLLLATTPPAPDRPHPRGWPR